MPAGLIEIGSLPIANVRSPPSTGVPASADDEVDEDGSAAGVSLELHAVSARPRAVRPVATRNAREDRGRTDMKVSRERGGIRTGGGDGPDNRRSSLTSSGSARRAGRGGHERAVR